MMAKLHKYVGSREKVQLTRPMPSEPTLNGYLLAMSDDLILMHPFDDFEPDGYTIIRAADVTAVRRCPYEEWWDHMLQQERLLDGLDSIPDIDLSDMRSAVKSVAALYDQMIVECEEEGDEGLEDFYLGKLISVADDFILFLDYDALGFWASKPKEIRLAEITKVQFDAPYIRIFSKYTREGTPPKFPEYDG